MADAMQPLTVIKNDHNGREMLRYDGHILRRDEQQVVLESHFNRDDTNLGYVHLRRGDRFVEHFYADRWYNVFAVYDLDDDRLKGWYCNITRPAIFGDATIHADDLALDLFVYPDGRMLILDEDEFATLPLSDHERQSAQAGLQDLQRHVQQRQPPFDTHLPENKSAYLE